MADGGSKLSKTASFGPDPVLEEAAESVGIWKFCAAASAWDSMLPIASYIGLLKSRFASVETS